MRAELFISLLGLICAVGCTSRNECGTGQYLKFEDGACGDGSGECADIPSACTLEFAPVCGCDGVTYPNRCHAEAAAVNVLAEGECEEESDACGGIAGLDCGDGQFCSFPIGTCGESDQTGTCEEIPQSCSEQFDPVCGCDGVTYSNRCDAEAHGVSIHFESSCADEGQICGGIAGLTCDGGQFCRYPTGSCGDGDQPGTCAAIPETCTEEFAPVCGCDGQEYDNECQAWAVEVSVRNSESCS